MIIVADAHGVREKSRVALKAASHLLSPHVSVARVTTGGDGGRARCACVERMMRVRGSVCLGLGLGGRARGGETLAMENMFCFSTWQRRGQRLAGEAVQTGRRV